MNAVKLSIPTIKLPTMSISMVGSLGGVKYRWEFAQLIDSENYELADSEGNLLECRDYRVKDE